jgi:hypothetical protein
MGDKCNIAFYYSDEPDDLSLYDFMLYRSRWGDLWSVGPLLAWALLDVYERGRTEEWSTERRREHLIEKLGQYDFVLAETWQDVFKTDDYIDFFYAVDNKLRINVYVSTGDSYEILLPNQTWGLRMIKSIDLLKTLRESP